MRHISFELHANAGCWFSRGVRHVERDRQWTDPRRLRRNFMRQCEVGRRFGLVSASLREHEANTKSN